VTHENEISKPKRQGYAYRKEFYRDPAVAEAYDQQRFTTPERQRRNVRKWRAIERALALAPGIERVLDLPCGTGRFTGSLARTGLLVAGADISIDMMRRAATTPTDTGAGRIAGYVDADAEALPFADGAFDCVVSIRFMMHVDPATRHRMLREFRRVAARWAIVDYRHRYTAKWLGWQLRHALGLKKELPNRVTRKGVIREFHDAGLAVRAIIPVRRLLSDKWIVLAEAVRDAPALDRELAEQRLAGTALEGARISGIQGEGKRSTVYRATWRGREIALKVYKRRAISNHFAKCGSSIAEFEHQRNRAFFDAPGLARYVAEPLAVVVTDGIQATAQELVEGPLYYFHRKQRGTDLAGHLREILRCAHAAGLYDVDLHAMNVLVATDETGQPLPKLFDFNMIPFTVRAPNPFVALGLRLGLLARESRDLRRLASIDDFRNIERKLLKYYGR
jgi:ubiquinone/menaquinone biosynthesis C-methylase UbiE